MSLFNAFADGSHFGVAAKTPDQFFICQTGGGYVGMDNPTSLVYYDWLLGSKPQEVVDDSLGGGSLSSAPVAIAAPVASGVIMAARGMNGNIYFQEGLGGWNQLPAGSLRSAPGICLENGNLHVFGRGDDDQLWHAYRAPSGEWVSWRSPEEGIPHLPVGIASAPSVTSPAPGRIDVVVQGQDNAVWHLYFEQGWSAWESLGGIVTAAPTCCWWWDAPTPTFHVFARGQDSQLWHKYFEYVQGEGTWQEWNNDPPALPGRVMSSAPVAVVAAADTVDVFAGSAGAEVWKTRWIPGSTGGWQPWISLMINSVEYPD